MSESSRIDKMDTVSKKETRKSNPDFVLKELQTERLSLRPFTTDDFDFIKKHFASESVNQYLYDNEPPSSD